MRKTKTTTISNEKHVKNIFAIHPWKLIQNKMNEENNDFLIAESLCSLGNGLLGSRGNFEEKYSGKMHSGVYNGGVWYPDKTKVGWWKNGYPNYFGKVINSLNFLKISVFINKEELDLHIQKPSKFYRELDMQNGILSRSFTTELAGISIDVETQRFYSLDDPESVYIKYSITPQQNCSIKFNSILDGDVRNLDSNHGEAFWLPIENKNVDNQISYVSIKTKQNPFGVQRFTVAAAMQNEINFKASKNKIITKDFLAEQLIETKAKANQTYTLVKKVAVLTSRQHEEEKLFSLCLDKNKKMLSYEKAYSLHANKWNQRWETSDIVIEGDNKAQQGIRFSLFQLFSTYYGEDPNLNIGPKGFTGEKYGGATYWDTEAYCVPVYLATAPSYVAKNLLLYRYNQLEQAKHNARQQGLDGALYPMVTFDGIECHNEWEITFEEIHRNGAMAYAIYNYTNYTADESYIQNEGIKVLVEIAKFWASRVHYNKAKKQYMMHGVTGPNEFDNNVNNNWYTNKIATWCLKYTLESLKKYNFMTKLKQFSLSEEALLKWKDIIKKMYYPYDKKLDIFVQFDTFLDKDLIRVDELDAKDRPIVHNWSWDKILRSVFIKQADVLQGIYLFQEEYSLEQIKRNYQFYEQYTVHESSLSPCIHSILAAKVDLMDDAERFYLRASRLDLDNYNDDTKDGLHITSMAGSWMSIVEGFGGFRIIKGKLHLSPKIPHMWKKYSFKVFFRNSIISVSVENKKIIITKKSSSALAIFVNEQKYSLKDKLEINL